MEGSYGETVRHVLETVKCDGGHVCSQVEEPSLKTPRRDGRILTLILDGTCSSMAEDEGRSTYWCEILLNDRR